jgi:hypothetical protein
VELIHLRQSSKDRTTELLGDSSVLVPPLHTSVISPSREPSGEE